MNTTGQRVRVLMTADTIGGVWTFTLELAAALEKLGCEILVATMGAPLTAAQRTEIRQLRNLTVAESRYRLEWMTNPWNDVDRAGDWLLELAAKFRPDIVHLNGYSHAALPWRIPVVVTAHSCVCSWWRAVRGEDAPANWNEYRRRVEAGLAAANLVVAPSNAMLDELQAIYGLPASAIVIPNVRDSRHFHVAAKQASILTAGRVWDAAKNIAALDVVATQVDWPIDVAGERENPDGSLAGLTNLRCLGRLSTNELATRLSTAAIFALPARYEPFGLSILEAGLSGCALVLGDIPSLREIWQNTAVFVNPDDHQQLAANLNNLIRDQWHRTDLSQRARVRALEIASRDIGRSYLDAYRACLSHQPQEVAA